VKAISIFVLLALVAGLAVGALIRSYAPQLTGAAEVATALAASGSMRCA
jgi:hypothetical protein